MFFIKSTNFKEVSFKISPDTNNLRCFDVDIVLIYSKQIHEMLLGKTTEEYFILKNGLLRENPYGLRIFSVEILPQKTYVFQKLPIDNQSQLIDCMVFCNFNNKNIKNSKILSLGNKQSITLRIDKNGISLDFN
jgi:hypothetical protein